MRQAALFGLWLAGCAPPPGPVPQVDAQRVTTGPVDLDLREVKYCTSTVTYWDVDDCVDEIGVDEARRREVVYVLELYEGRLEQREMRRGLTWLEDGGTGYDCGRFAFEYDGAGHFTRGTCRDRRGNVTSKARVSADRLRYDYLDAHDRPRSGDHDSIVAMQRTFDERGRVMAYRFLDDVGRPTPNTVGVYGRSIALTASGAAFEMSALDAEGRPMADKNGVHREKYDLDARGFRREESFYGMLGEPVLGSGGFHRRLNRYDDVGNLIGSSFYGTDGVALVIPGGHAGFERTFDLEGRLLSVVYLGLDGEPTRSSARYASRRYAYDRKGRTVRTSYHDEHDAPVTLAAGYHAVSSVYDAKDFLVEQRLVDVSGALASSSWRPAIERFTRNGRGDVTSVRYFDAGEKPAAKDPLRAYGYDVRYDESGDVVERSYVDAMGEVADLAIGGYATVRFEHDHRGATKTVRYADAAGHEVDVVQVDLVCVKHSASAPADPTRLPADAHAVALDIVRAVTAGRELEVAARAAGQEVLHVPATRREYLRANVSAALTGLTEGAVSGVVELSLGACLVWVGAKPPEP